MMKVSVFLVAAIRCAPVDTSPPSSWNMTAPVYSSLKQEMVHKAFIEPWWKAAVESFNDASNDLAKLTAGFDSVSGYIATVSYRVFSTPTHFHSSLS